MIRYMKFISRDYIKSHRNIIFLFGDNILERGFGGQAYNMRGEINSIGIPTKKKPSMSNDSFFTDLEFEQNKIVIDKAFSKIPKGKDIIIPSAGLGVGLSQLPKYAPKTFKYLKRN